MNVLYTPKSLVQPTSYQENTRQQRYDIKQVQITPFRPLARSQASKQASTTLNASSSSPLLSNRHTLHLLGQGAPIIRLQLSILDTFLRPFLMQSTNVILALLEEEKFIADAFADEDAAGMLLDNGLLVLFPHISYIIPKMDPVEREREGEGTNR
jgi:hypothetical protein